MFLKTFFLILLCVCLSENTSDRRCRRNSASSDDSKKHGTHTGKNRAVYVKCRPYFNLRHQSKKENYGRRANQPLGPLCRPHMDKLMNCFAENIYNSSHPYDVVLRTNTNFVRLKNATKKLCKDYKTYKPNMSRCLLRASQCINRIPMHRHMVDSHRLCSWRKVRCDYKAFSECDMKGAMMASRYFYETSSNGCILTNPLFQLLPKYGPELDCYSFITMEGIEYMNLAQVYDHFCKNFDRNRVVSCIEERFPNITSDQLLEDRVAYVAKAKKFAQHRHRMCKDLYSSDNDVCMRDGKSVDLRACRRNMFISAVENDRTTLEEAVKKYSECVFKKYSKCNLSLATIIKDNMQTWDLI